MQEAGAFVPAPIMARDEDDDLDAMMARLAAGDRSAFTPVFEMLHGPVRKLCVGLLRNEEDAADAAQDAMHKILERSSDYDKGRRALPWALAIAGWECRTIARRRMRRREAPEEEAGGGVGMHPEEGFIRRDLAVAALAAMGELSELDRETLIATFWNEAAPVAGATLRKRRERAVKRLRDAFRRMYGLD